MESLLGTLRKKGHSGCIEGICKLNIPKKYESIEKWVESKSVSDISGTFSCGTEPLGTCQLRFLSAVPSLNEVTFEVLFSEKQPVIKGTIIVQINTEEVILAYGVYSFKAVFSKD